MLVNVFWHLQIKVLITFHFWNVIISSNWRWKLVGQCGHSFWNIKMWALFSQVLLVFESRLNHALAEPVQCQSFFETLTDSLDENRRLAVAAGNGVIALDSAPHDETMSMISESTALS